MSASNSGSLLDTRFARRGIGKGFSPLSMADTGGASGVAPSMQGRRVATPTGRRYQGCRPSGGLEAPLAGGPPAGKWAREADGSKLPRLGGPGVARGAGRRRLRDEWRHVAPSPSSRRGVPLRHPCATAASASEHVLAELRPSAGGRASADVSGVAVAAARGNAPALHTCRMGSGRAPRCRRQHATCC